VAELSVLHLSTADNIGGSGRSAYKIHDGLRRLGVRSRMLVGVKVTSDPDVGTVSRGWRKALDRAAEAATARLGGQYLFIPSSNALLSHPWFKEADVVQIYNTHGGYFSHSVLPALSREKPVVWRLSDLWPMTGHCAYPGDCEKWRTGCAGCPDLQTYPSIPFDTAGWLWRKKERLYRDSRLHVVAPSEWIRRMAAASPLLAPCPRSVIVNGVDVNLFRVMDKAACRDELKIPTEKKAVLFSAHVLTDNPRKGGSHFIEAVNALPEALRDQTAVLLVGEGAESWGRDLRCEVWRHGFVREDARLAAIYNAADVLAHPAVVENLPNSVLEAMACGLPAVAFDTGGVGEIVEHGRTGLLSPAKDTAGLAKNLAALLTDDALRRRLSAAGRVRVLERHTADGQARAFLNLYTTLVSHAAA